jgi:hypothetical protein
MFFHKRTAEEIAKAGGPTPPGLLKSLLKWTLITIPLLFVGGVGAIALESKLHERKRHRR